MKLLYKQRQKGKKKPSKEVLNIKTDDNISKNHLPVRHTYIVELVFSGCVMKHYDQRV